MYLHPEEFCISPPESPLPRSHSAEELARAVLSGESRVIQSVEKMVSMNAERQGLAHAQGNNTWGGDKQADSTLKP
jgi:hypothetical protein